MGQDLTDTLCTRCGLCCDGSLFADVELESAVEIASLEILGLGVEEGDGKAGLLSQPCRALMGRRCGIYAHRPKCCRTFECALLQNVRTGAVTVAQARTHIARAFTEIRRVRTLLSQLGERGAQLPLAERCADVLAKDMGSAPGMKRKQTQLESAMTTLEDHLRRTFLGREGTELYTISPGESVARVE